MFLSILKKKKGFSLVEILIVIAIIGVLARVVMGSLTSAREKGIFTRAKQDLHSVAQALELYSIDNGEYPPDVSRGLPNGIEVYLPSGDWPLSAWPESVFDWENWVDPETGEPIYQISIRFCPIGGPLADCAFPDEEWAVDFDIDSSVYYCVEGACRAHVGQPIEYPGYCINCQP